MPDRTPTQSRVATFDVSARANDAAIPVVVSTDAVVEVIDGPEILVHTSDAIDMQRAPLPIIATHASGQINVGVVENLTVSDGALRGMARFGERPEAAGFRADVLNQIIRSVSAGYRRLHAKVRRDGVLVTDRWMPTHVAMVAEPADVGAGFFRTADGVPTSFIEVEREAEPAPVAAPAETKEQPDSVRILRVDSPAAPAAQPGVQSMDQSTTAAAGSSAEAAAVRNDGTEQERLRIKAITAMARSNKVEDAQRDQWIDAGKSADEVAHAILGIIAERTQRNPETPAKLDLSSKDLRQYSMVRAINAVLDRKWDKAGFEMECSRAIAERLQKTPSANTFYVPFDVQQHGRRDVTVGTPSAGGYLVDTQNQSFVEILRNRSVAFSMGARRLSGLRGNVTIPKQTGAATAYWLGTEATAITESAQTFAQISMSPHTVGAYTEVSRQLMLQASPDIEALVNSDLAAVVAIEMDRVALRGSGAGGEPLGIVNTTNVGTTTATTVDYSKIIDFQEDLAAANIRPVSGGYVTTSAVAGILMGKQRFSSTDTPLWEGTLWDGTMAGYRAMSSEQMASGTMLFGDWTELVIGEWGVLEVDVNPAANFAAGIVGIRAMYTVDIAVRRAEAFSYSSSVTA